MSKECENWGLIIRRLLPKVVEKRSLTPAEKAFRDAVMESVDWLAYSYGWKHVDVMFGTESVDIAYTSHGKPGLTYVRVPLDVLDNASNAGLRRLTRGVSDAIDNESKVALCRGMYVDAGDHAA